MSFGSTIEDTHKDLEAQIGLVKGNGFEEFARHVHEKVPSLFSSEEATQFVSFLWSMLQQDPQRRSCTSVLLNHLFLG